MVYGAVFHFYSFFGVLTVFISEFLTQFGR